MKLKTYEHKELSEVIEGLSAVYDKVRLVEPEECREVILRPDGTLEEGAPCFDAWESGQRCANCSSLRACRSLQKVEKTEFYREHAFHVMSIPVLVRLPGEQDPVRFVMECINRRQGVEWNDTDSAGALSGNTPDIDKNTAESSANGLYDPLTGLKNWEGFYRSARSRMRTEEGQQWVIIVYDIMHFKMVNELFGVNKGDEVLCRVGALIRSKIGPGEECARLESDRFAVLIRKEHFGDEFTISASRELADLINSPLFHLHIQAGVYFVHDISLPIFAMCDRAKIALSMIRNNSHLRISIFDEELMKQIRHEQYVIGEFERALKDGEFRMFLQPQVEKDGKIIGCEALSRWITADGTVVPPGEFIGILERSELIVRLDRYIWEEAVKKLAAWKNTSFDSLYISINISPKDFYYLDVFTYLEELIERYQVPRSRLKLEITESVVMQDAIKQLALVNRLHEQGYDIEIDDFGKGYSSLSLLKDISADTIKIDKEFLRESDNDLKSERILVSVFDLSERLNMRVITEGVETESQLQKLIRLGCHMFQGFYFARPMSVDWFEELYLESDGMIAGSDVTDTSVSDPV